MHIHTNIYDLVINVHAKFISSIYIYTNVISMHAMKWRRWDKSREINEIITTINSVQRTMVGE